MEILFLIVALLLMLAGVVGTVMPVIPSVPIVYAGYFVYGLATNWRDYGLKVMVAFGALTVLVLVMDYVAGAVGAKKFGGSKAGMWGSIVGAIVGVIFFNLLGLILGTFFGALLAELIWGRTFSEAFRSGVGAFIGFLAGSFFKIAAAVAMFGTFLWLIIF